MNNRQLKIHGSVHDEKVIELPEGWPDDMMNEVSIKVFRDEIYLLHPQHPPYKLVNDKWEIFPGYID